MRRTWLRGRENIHKRYLIDALMGHNDAAFGQDQLDVAQAETEPAVNLGNAITMAIRCKMRLSQVIGNNVRRLEGNIPPRVNPKLVAEDAGFQKATPSGMAEFQIDNPKAVEQLVIGQTYYFDITPAPAA